KFSTFVDWAHLMDHAQKTCNRLWNEYKADPEGAELFRNQFTWPREVIQLCNLCTFILDRLKEFRWEDVVVQVPMSFLCGLEESTIKHLGWTKWSASCDRGAVIMALAELAGHLDGSVQQAKAKRLFSDLWNKMPAEALERADRSNLERLQLSLNQAKILSRAVYRSPSFLTLPCLRVLDLEDQQRACGAWLRAKWDHLKSELLRGLVQLCVGIVKGCGFTASSRKLLKDGWTGVKRWATSPWLNGFTGLWTIWKADDAAYHRARQNGAGR
ncbi:MAG: hypothetical protein ACOYKZ_02835, partial [Chlamydiia bacterium]